jgi:hypothetical protein
VHPDETKIKRTSQAFALERLVSLIDCAKTQLAQSGTIMQRVQLTFLPLNTDRELMGSSARTILPKALLGGTFDAAFLSCRFDGYFIGFEHVWSKYICI